MKTSWLTIALLASTVICTQAQDASTPPWQDTDIGPAPQAGSAQSDGAGGYTVTSYGGDIFNWQDSCHYVYQTIGTNEEVVVRVLGINATNGYAKAGLMIRETLEGQARESSMVLTASNGLNFLWRDSYGGRTEWTAVITKNLATPYWLKMVRYGDWVGGYASPDGITWTLAGWQTMKGAPSQMYVGLAVSAHNDGTNNSPVTAQFDQVHMGPADMSEVIFPVVGSGDGLWGNYYDNRHLSGTAVTNRVDAQLDFNFWDMTHVGVTNDATYTNRCLQVLGIPRNREFGARWTGEVQAQFTEPYTFYVMSDDGVRVWLNEQLIVDDWHCQPAKETLATVNLVAGQRYLLRVEYFQNYSGDQVSLAWSSPSTFKRVIPQSQLYSQPTDTDGNGLPDLWEIHYFGQIGVDPNADPDGDGLSNLQEYQRHSDPTNPLNWGVPNEWTHGDIEDTAGGSDGNASYSNGVFAVTSHGGDIFSWQDSCHYMYQTIGTNEEVVVRVLGINATNGYAKAGLMIRETLEGQARESSMVLTASNGLNFLWRDSYGGRTEWTAVITKNLATPYWLKMVRYGDWVGGYASPDGITWTLAGWQTMKGAPSQMYVGLAVSAHNNGTNNSPATAQFDQVHTGPAGVSEVIFPVVGSGDGLLGSYRNDSLLYLPGLTNRVDPQVDCWWGQGPPMSFLNPDSYGVCWSGELQAQFTEPYTFSLEDLYGDWVRVWVNEQLVIDGWRVVSSSEILTGKTLNLVAGRHYLIRVEMYNNLGRGRAVLRWSSPSTPNRVIPQSQLYSQPEMDPDGSGLPAIWEMIYFGHLGVDPNADPDGDGLSNLQEYRYHTNPTKADTDGDGIPDAWEIAHGLDPQYPDDAGLDYDNSGWSNLQDYLYGLDPSNPDINGDGLPDAFEVEYLGAGPTLSVTNSITVAASANGAQATNFLGRWGADGNDIYAWDRRGGLDFILSVSKADKYVLNLIGTQNEPNPLETSFKLQLGIDGQSLGHYTLNGGYGTNGVVEAVLPYLKAGTHTVHVFWDGVASQSSLRIKQVKLLAISGSTTNQTGLKDWVVKMVAGESGLDNANPVIGSYTSPVCLEGRDPYPLMMQLTNNLTNALSPVATTDGRWYVNAPLQANTQTVFQASYQNGALTETRQLQWVPVNLLTTINNLTIRKGDSLLFSVLPSSKTNGSAQINIGTNTYTGTATKPVACKFTTAGTYTVTGTYTPKSGSSQNGSVTVDVVQQSLPNVEPAAWTWQERNLNLASLAPEATLQADSRLTCFIARTNANGAVQLALGTEENEECSILARLGTNGPVLDSTRVSGFDEWSGSQAYTQIGQVYPDGSQLIEMLIISSPVETNVTFVLEPIVSGVIFDDGTTVKTLTATNFDALGQCPVRFIRPAGVQTSVCHSIKAYQGNYQIGYRH